MVVPEVPQSRKHYSNHDSFPKKRNLLKKKDKRKVQMKKSMATGLAAGRPVDKTGVEWRPLHEQARWLTDAFYSAHGSSLSQLENDPIPEDSLVRLSDQRDRHAQNLSWHAKSMFGDSWKDALCKRENAANNENGSPAFLILCSSALRCVVLLKGLRNLTKECKPAKLFAKHIKLDEQVKALEGYVNIAAGTPNRVKKLIDIGALGLGCLSVVLLDMHRDAKDLTLLTLPQVKSEFWELYRDHFHQQVLNKNLKICFY